MNKLKLELPAVCPFVRYAEDVRISHSTNSCLRRAYDHRLFYVVAGCVHFETDEDVWDVGAGSVLYWKSGTSYFFRPADGCSLRMIKLNFDFTKTHSTLTQPIPVVPEQDWNPEQQLEPVEFTDAQMLNSPLILSDVPQLLPYLHSIVHEMEMPQSFGGVLCGNLMNAVLVLLCREAQQRQRIKKMPDASHAILEYVNSHYAEELTNQKLASIFGYHVNYISCLVSEQTGMPLHRYLLRLRIRQSLNLLTTTQMPIGEIANAVGFKSTSYFSQYFKKCTGYAPGKFRMG